MIASGSVIRIYELREFFPLRLPDQVNEFILSYVPFILGTFISTIAAAAGIIVGINWIFNGFRQVSKLKLPFVRPGEFYRPEDVHYGLQEGKLKSYDRCPSLLFLFLSKLWSNARYISEIPGRIVRWNIRFIWKALAMGIVIHFMFKALKLLPPYLSSWGLGTGYVIPSPMPFFNLLAVVCVLKLLVAFSLIPLKRPSASREMDSMIVEGRGHPTIFFSVLEEGSRIFAHKGFSNNISRSTPVTSKDGETTIGTVVESFPEYVKTSPKLAAILCSLLGSVMILVGFLQIILMQYPSFSVSYEDFFRLYSLNLIMDIMLNVTIILFGKSFLDQARSIMAIYRFRSSIVYVEAKGDFDRNKAPELGGIVAPERLFDPLAQCAYNVRYFSAESVSQSITPEGPRELVALETSGKLAKDIGRLKYLPFQIHFEERYPSKWNEPDQYMVADADQEVVIDSDAHESEEVTPGIAVSGNTP